MNYLKDLQFLKELDELNIRVTYAKITLLSFNEKPIKEIQGNILTGTLNMNGSSAVRRTINLTMVMPASDFILTDLNGDISLNKKIKIEIGYANPLEKYKKYGDIVWFPCGIFVISNANISKTVQGWTVSIQGKDKMVLLDGTVGGTLPASVTFHEIYTYNEKDELIIEKPTIFQIIQEAVHHWGKEQIYNIMISDIPQTAKLLIKYMGESPIYFDKDFNSFSYEYDSLNYPQKYIQGQDIGYEETPFIYPGELVLNAGETVVSLLNKICSVLGNFEFFYDVNGKFIFQEKKNHLNKRSPLLELKTDNYISTYSNTAYQYSLTNLKTVTSLNQSPKYDNIKNDFIVWGEKETLLGSKVRVRYHLAVDVKPQDIPYSYKGGPCSNCHKNLIEIIDKQSKSLKRYEPYYLNRTEIEEEKRIDKNIEEFGKIILNSLDAVIPPGVWVVDYAIIEHKTPPHPSHENYIFTVEEKGADGLKYPLSSYYWDERKEEYILLNQKYPKNYSFTKFNWREEIYRLALINSNAEDYYYPYYAELLAEWRNLYDPSRKEWIDYSFYNPDVFNNPSNLNYWLDFIDSNSELGEYSISAIGRRSIVINDSNIKSVYNNTIPDVIFLKSEPDNPEYINLLKKYASMGQTYFPVTNETYDKFIASSTKASAFDKVRELLYQHLVYYTQVTISCLPKYYMEPNNIIYVEDKSIGICNNYEISQISLPLNYNGMMSIVATEVLTKE